MIFYDSANSTYYLAFPRTGTTVMEEVVSPPRGLKLVLPSANKNCKPGKLIVIFRDPWERFRSWNIAFHMQGEDNIWNKHAPIDHEEWLEYFSYSMHYDGHTALQYFLYLDEIFKFQRERDLFTDTYFLNTKNISKHFGLPEWNSDSDFVDEFSIKYKDRLTELYKVDYEWIDSFGAKMITY